MDFFIKITDFLKEVKAELKKVTWPTRQETIRYTLMVILISLGVAFFLGFGDFIFSWLLNKFII
jgi:preprotein translocase subunit SecE